MLQGIRRSSGRPCRQSGRGVFPDRFLYRDHAARAAVGKARSFVNRRNRKSDAEFEAFLLEILSDEITVPEIGAQGETYSLVVLTSNNSQEMSDALKRRCLHSI